MSNFDWANHAKGCECQPCRAFGKVMLRVLEHVATAEDQEGHPVAFHFKAWLKGSLDAGGLR